MGWCKLLCVYVVYKEQNFTHMIDLSSALTQKSFPIFSSLTTEQWAKITSNLIVDSFDKKDIIYKEGDKGTHIFIVIKGSVKLASTIQNQHELIKDVVQEGDLFGESIFKGIIHRKEYAMPISKEVVIGAIPKDVFLSILSQNRMFTKQFIALSLERLKSLETRVENFVFKKAKSRISSFLVRASKLRGIKIGLDEWLINHGLSHREIAFLTDTSRQTVARVLGELKREEYIHFSSRKPSKILIRNIQGLTSV